MESESDSSIIVLDGDSPIRMRMPPSKSTRNRPPKQNIKKQNHRGGGGSVRSVTVDLTSSSHSIGDDDDDDDDDDNDQTARTPAAVSAAASASSNDAVEIMHDATAAARQNRRSRKRRRMQTQMQMQMQMQMAANRGGMKPDESHNDNLNNNDDDDDEVAIVEQPVSKPAAKIPASTSRISTVHRNVNVRVHPRNHHVQFGASHIPTSVKEGGGHRNVRVHRKNAHVQFGASHTPTSVKEGGGHRNVHVHRRNVHRQFAASHIPTKVKEGVDGDGNGDDDDDEVAIVIVEEPDDAKKPAAAKISASTSASASTYPTSISTHPNNRPLPTFGSAAATSTHPNNRPLPTFRSIAATATATATIDDVQVISVARKLTPRQTAMQQIIEIFPDMDPTHITTHLTKIETANHLNGGITTQAIQGMIQEFLTEKSYPKIRKEDPHEKKRDKLLKSKTVDYANDEFDQSIQYKYQANDRLLNDFPFMSKSGIQRLMQKYNGRYHKSYMHIVETIKKYKKYKDDSPIECYDEFTRLMSGGRLKSDVERGKFKVELNGIQYDTTLKNPKKHRGSIEVTDKILRDEMAFTKKMIRLWGKTIQKEKNRLVARKKAEESGDTVECSCCYGDYASMEMVKCMEGHQFCMDCLRRYAETKVFSDGDLGKKGSTELCCMDMSGCQSFFSREQLIKSLSEKVMKKYDELQTTLVLEKAGLDDLCRCPKCDLQVSLPESQKVLNCPSCGYESCRLCGEESHIPLRCEEVEKKTETSARLQIEEAMTKARIRHCPKGCKQGFYKTEGCNKMTCPTCKTWICYVCRKEIPKNVSYKHFCQTPHCDHKRCSGCPLYSNAEEDDARASREAGIRTAQELKGDSRTEDVAEKMESILNGEQQASTRAIAQAQNVTVINRNARAIARMQARDMERIAEQVRAAEAQVRAAATNHRLHYDGRYRGHQHIIRRVRRR